MGLLDAWPLDLPARDVLRLPEQAAIKWAAFDAAWYREAYPDAPDAPAALVLEWHIDTGQRLGRSPNRLFDELWHQAHHPALAARIANGEFASAFDAYCRRGCLDRSAHWLFDELAYRDRYPDLTNDVLRSAELANGYDHFLRHGAEEGRVGHPLFQPDVYLAQFDPADADAVRKAGVFQHYLARIETKEPELRTSVYFDPEWYVRRYPEVAAAISAGRWKSALHHYLCNDSPIEFDPNESFSESFYLGGDPGLREALKAGYFRNGYAHFLRFGAQELRAPSAGVDIAWYASQAAVKTDLETGLAENAYAHWLTIGRANNLASTPPDEVTLTEAQARIAFQQTALALTPAVGRFGCNFETAEPPLSVVMVTRNGFPLTVAAIAALRANTAQPIELVLIDTGSSDETTSIERYVPGAVTVHLAAETSWVQAASCAQHLARAPVLAFLASGARLAPGALDRAYRRLMSDEAIGAVGGMIVKPSGLIGQAGGIVWNDGGTHDYMRGRSPVTPEANFVRQVDFCSSAFLMVRADILSRLNGFDDGHDPGYAAIDLCLRLAEAGLKVIYDPAVVVFHDDEADPPGEPSQHFLNRHAAALAGRYPRGGAVQTLARHSGQVPQRILFIEDTIPLRGIGSGFVRSNDLVRVMDELGSTVTVFPVNGCTQDPAHIFNDMPETVEVMHTHSLGRLKEFLEARPLYYDVVWVARAHNLDRVRPILSHLQTNGILRARVILDTEAVTPPRDALLAGLAGQGYDLNAGMQAFIANKDICQAVVAVTDVEAAMLREYGMPNVVTIGHMIQPRPTGRRFDQRSGMLFVGAIHKEDSPNYDSLVWFSEEVLPLIERQLRWETRLTIAGYVAPGVDMSRFERHPRLQILGPVVDLTSAYDHARVFVAPTRYAAGAPYKVLEAAAHGVPVVATSLLLSELGWSPDQDALAAAAGDAMGFAARVVALYRGEALWHSVRQHALGRLDHDNGSGAFTETLRAVLSTGECL